GAEVSDVAKTGGDRPGRAAVVKMANGKYMMEYELGNGPISYGAYFKISDDGDNWGDPTDLGTLGTTADASYLSNSPELIARPASTAYPNGELVRTAWMLPSKSGALDSGTGTT